MKKLIILILFSAIPALGQGVRYDSIAFAQGGKPLAGATITVCTSAGTGTPCTPLASIYTNQALTTTQSNPFTADSNGNYGFWAAPGTYFYSITGTGITGFSGYITLASPNAAIKPAASDAVQYISINGNDANDGFSMGTAKGNADLGVAVAAAQTAIGSNPGTIYILPGAYNLSTAIKCVNNITIMGYGAVVTSTVTGSSLVCANTFRSGVFGLRFIGPATTGSSVGLQLGINSGGTGSPTEWNTFKDLWFSNFHLGIDGQGSSGGNGTFYNTLINVTANSDGIGWHLIPGTSNFLNDNTILSGFSASNTSDGWEIDGANGNAILNGESEINGGCGVNFVGNNSTQGNTFSGGWLESNTTADICSGSSTNVQFNAFLGTTLQSATPFSTLALLQSGHNIIQPGSVNSTAKDFYANALEASSLFLLSSGGGTITHQAPNTAGTFTITDPAATGISTVSTSCGTVDLTAQGANIGSTTLCTPSAAGFYRASCYVVLTRAATTSSTLPSCSILWTDADSNALENFVYSTTSTSNIVGTVGSLQTGNVLWLNAKSGQAIQYTTQNYASSGATSMQYAVHVRLEGPF